MKVVNKPQPHLAALCGLWPRLEVTRLIEATMETQKVMLSEFPWDERYRVCDTDNVLTPALVVYPEIIASNIALTKNHDDGRPNIPEQTGSRRLFYLLTTLRRREPKQV